MGHHGKTETYNGHKLVADANQVRTGWWGWTYVIDGKISGASTARSLLPDAESALRRAIQAAKIRADALE